MFYLHLTHYIGFFGAQVFNSILSILIVKRAGKLFGAYRHVMLIFALCSMWFSWVEILTQPVMHMKGSMLVVFIDHSHYSSDFGEFIIRLHCASFGFLISVFPAQFFYRYAVLCNSKSLTHLDGPRVLLFFLPSTVVYLTFFELVKWGMSATPEKREYSRKELQDQFGVDSMAAPMVASYYWAIGSDGEKQWRSEDLISSGLCSLIITLVSTIILFFALKIYFHMKNDTSHMSSKTIELSRQLFRMLIVQTIVPFILMYIPVSFVIVFPFFGISFGEYTNFASASIAIYPSIEPLIAMYCIADFRETLRIVMFLLHLIHYIGFIGAQTNNSILSFLILKKAPKLFGAYRHVMLTFTVCSMWFSWVEIATQPVVHHRGPMFVMFLEQREYSERVGHFIACLHCGTFGFITSVLAAQFFYRYLVLCKPQVLNFLTGFRLFSIFLPGLLIYILWSAIVDWGMSATPEKREYLREELKLHFDIDSMTVPFIAAWYWEGTLCFSILFFALNIYFRMKNASAQMSQKTLDLNRQLFVMLCVQTLFPFFTMYIPVGLLIGLPLLNLSMNPYTNYPSASLAIYPLIEPLIAMYCINDFRKTILKFVGKWKRGASVSTVKTYIVNANHLGTGTSTGSAVP